MTEHAGNIVIPPRVRARKSVETRGACYFAEATEWTFSAQSVRHPELSPARFFILQSGNEKTAVNGPFGGVLRIVEGVVFTVKWKLMTAQTRNAPNTIYIYIYYVYII
jgi:hypothetical protein